MKALKKYRGVIVPMVTPFNPDFTIDTEAVDKILASFIDAEVAPFILGTTGESTSISEKQKLQLAKQVMNNSAEGQVTFAGISGNCLEESIEIAKAFANMGVDVVVAHLPFYYPMSDVAVTKFYENLANSIPCPLMLYNNPITVKQSINIEVIDQLSHHPNIVGVKDSERSMERLNESLELWSDRSDFAYYLGWAPQSAYALLRGADGIVPSTGNLTPALYRNLFNSAIQQNDKEAEVYQQLTNRISEVYQRNRNISQSIPALKILMEMKGLCKSIVMPPMYELDQVEKEVVQKEYREMIENQLINI